MISLTSHLKISPFQSHTFAIASRVRSVSPGVKTLLGFSAELPRVTTPTGASGQTRNIFTGPQGSNSTGKQSCFQYRRSPRPGKPDSDVVQHIPLSRPILPVSTARRAYSTTTRPKLELKEDNRRENMSGDSKGPTSSASPAVSNVATGASGDGVVTPTRPRPQFQVSPIPPNPLGEGKCIRTAAALIIGDEILNGKTRDTNSNVFAQFCFEHGIDLKRIEVIPDDETEIIEAARRLSSKFDLVVSSGGIGPTHDDITYESLAKAFNTTVVHNEETINRMRIMNQYRPWAALQDEQQRAASYRMALFPANAEVIFIDPEIWVPVVRLDGKLCVLPGVPGLFQKILHALAKFLPLPPKNERPLRIQIFTERPESMIAPYLTKLQERLRPHGIQVGSYPVLYKGVFVSLIGRDLAYNSRPASPSSTHSDPSTSIPPEPPTSTSKPPAEAQKQKRSESRGRNQGNRVWLAEIAREVEKEVDGRILSEEEVAQQKKDVSITPSWAQQQSSNASTAQVYKEAQGTTGEKEPTKSNL
ncbi:Molybdopterin binding protein [Coprinopsis marcescibilis]|uniref:Molybdopterin binding protein n=1 Tax=Coprinopsis marcescibilis TaxID=230819 RepID=A0A5C3LAY3_COPMA|nr:Molybdopterin binding protein [Coprinopsis marcescibilis]